MFFVKSEGDVLSAGGGGIRIDWHGQPVGPHRFDLEPHHVQKRIDGHHLDPQLLRGLQLARAVFLLLGGPELA